MTASAGNHGLSVAAAAQAFGAKAVIYLAESVPESFADRLRAKGAKVVRRGAVYEDAMAAAVRDADENGWHLVSDSSGAVIAMCLRAFMQGYSVIAEELRAALDADGVWPTMLPCRRALVAWPQPWRPTSARTGLCSADCGRRASEAACLQASVRAGRPVRLTGGVSTQGRLDCKEPSHIAFEVLRETADAFVSVSDTDADKAVGMLAAHGIATTPSGAAGLAGLMLSDLSQTREF